MRHECSCRHASREKQKMGLNRRVCADLSCMPEPTLHLSCLWRKASHCPDHETRQQASRIDMQHQRDCERGNGKPLPHAVAIPACHPGHSSQHMTPPATAGDAAAVRITGLWRPVARQCSGSGQGGGRTRSAAVFFAAAASLLAASVRSTPGLSAENNPQERSARTALSGAHSTGW